MTNKLNFGVQQQFLGDKRSIVLNVLKCQYTIVIDDYAKFLGDKRSIIIISTQSY
ncbi:MAG: hypothetical protein ACRYFA_12795 [Janthinobacterium lividum]